MEKQIFKEGDRVFDIRFGWGEVITTKCTGYFNSDNILQVLFKNPDNSIWYTKDGLDYKWSKQPLLSFTEYTLEGFSQERPINYEDYIGKWGKFWDGGKAVAVIEKFSKYDGNMFYTKNYGYFEFFEPLTEEQIKILGLE